MLQRFCLLSLLLVLCLSAPAMAEQVRCKSHDYRHNHCAMDTRGRVRLVEQRSDAPCRRGRSWGVDNRGVWVNNGCEGIFESDRDRRQNRRDDRYTEEAEVYSSPRNDCKNTIAGDQCGR